MPDEPTPGAFAWRVTLSHTGAYLVAGGLAQALFDYGALFEAIGPTMRPVDSPMVALGPVLQLVNGAAMAGILWPLRGVLLGPGGARALFLLVVGLTVFAPQAPSPGSFEGWIYTTVPLRAHLLGLPECLLYGALFAGALTAWSRRPGRGWTAASGVVLVLVGLVSTLGTLDALGLLPAP